MHIVFSFDNNYAPYVSTLMNSINWNNDAEIKYHCVCANVDAKNKKQIYEHGDVMFYEHIPPYGPECSYGNLHLKSYAIYNVCFIASLVEVEKVIYMDVDNIVMSDLTELWETETSEKGYAACYDLRAEKVEMLVKHQSDSKFKYEYGEQPAFNNSVMVMDLDKMRANRAEPFMHDLLDRYGMSDMVVQNLYANGDWVQLDRKWCISANYYQEKVFSRIPREDWKILTWHGMKPWDGGKLREYWERYGTN